ncbi:MAG: PD40 domain-containing protein [Bryobacterales bacterium]|nr:PD40 domain-containing protein [Bryobacterales bacterium]
MIPATAPRYQFDGVLVDPVAFRATRAGQPLTLEPRAFHLLLYLVENPNRLITKEELIQSVWSGAFVTDNALTRVIAQLRRELGDNPKSPRYIETIPTQGYRFLATVEIAPAPAAPKPAPSAPPPARRLPRLPLAISAALLLAAGAFLAGRQTNPISPTNLQTLQFTTGEGLQLGAAFSPDGNTLAYASDKSGRFELYIRPLTPGAREIPLTSDGLMNIMPAWSPDGRWIAYHSAALNALRLIPATGGTPRTLSDFGLEPAWAPDSQRLVFRSGVYLSPVTADFGSLRASRLFLVNLSGGAPTPITDLPLGHGGHTSPCWSSGSNSVYFLTASSLTATTLWRLPMDRPSQPEPLHRANSQTWFSLACAPGGRDLYLSSATPAFEFSISRLSTGAPAALPQPILQTGLLVPRNLAVSSTGKLAYTLMALSSNLHRLPLDPATGLPSGPPTELTRETGTRVTLPTFSPDGSLVAYNARRLGVQSDIYVVPSTGGEPEQITTNPAPEVMPNWLADSRTLVFTRKSGNSASLVKVSVGDARTTELTPLVHGPNMARVSPTGDRFLFQSWASGHLGLYLSGMEQQPPLRLTPPNLDIGYASWSPNGARIAAELFENDFTHLIVLDAKGGPLRRLTRVPGQSWPNSWAPDNDRIAIAGQRNGLWGLYSISASTGKEVTLLPPALARGFVRYPGWSPRGDSLVYERAEARGNLFILDLP